MGQTVMKLAEISALQAAQMTGKYEPICEKISIISALQAAQMAGEHDPNCDETSRDLRPAGCTNRR